MTFRGTHGTTKIEEANDLGNGLIARPIRTYLFVVVIADHEVDVKVALDSQLGGSIIHHIQELAGVPVQSAALEQ